MIQIESSLFKYGEFKEKITLEFESHEQVLSYINRSLELTEHNSRMSDLYEECCHSKYFEGFVYEGKPYYLEVDC